MADADKPAAPTAQAEETFTRHSQLPGLSKREVAAIAAMQGLSANPAFFQPEVLRATGMASGMTGTATAAQILALVAVEHADALFAELAKGAQA